jgi:hypothetical protein
MRMLKSSFESALLIAIRAQEAEGNTNTTFTAGLRDVLDASEAGEPVIIAESDENKLYLLYFNCSTMVGASVKGNMPARGRLTLQFIAEQTQIYWRGLQDRGVAIKIEQISLVSAIELEEA